MIPKAACILAVAVAVVSASPAGSAQKPGQKLSGARALYYTPTAQGLKSFHCDLIIDWKDLLTRIGGSDVKDDNPFFKYLQTARLSVTDDLKGHGKLEWANTATPPEGKEAAAEQLKSGVEQMMNGFYDSWNGYMNGNMIPIPDSSTTVTETDGTLHLYQKAGTTEVNESFDKNLLLTEAHVVMPTIDVIAYATYEDTPDGRIVSAVRSVYRQPPTAPPGEVSMKISYATVSKFQLPETVSYDVKNVASFVFKFSACAATTTDKAPEKP